MTDAASPLGSETWVFRLYIAGQTPKSIAAFTNLNRLCEQLQQPHAIEVIDLKEDPQRARDDQILAIPTLVRRFPEPILRVIGDLSNTDRVLFGLGLPPRSASSASPAAKSAVSFR